MSRNLTITKTMPRPLQTGVTGRLQMTPKGGTQQFRVKNQKQNLSPTFCAGTVHTDRCQCVVLSGLAFSATTIFATVGL